jgi:hypothetical protein
MTGSGRKIEKYLTKRGWVSERCSSTVLDVYPSYLTGKERGEWWYSDELQITSYSVRLYDTNSGWSFLWAIHGGVGGAASRMGYTFAEFVVSFLELVP